MNIVLWILAGGMVGWASYSFLHFNQERGVMISIVIGAFGGFLGGKMIAPMFTAAAAVPGDFSLAPLFFAAAVAAGLLAAGNMVYERWGV